MKRFLFSIDPAQFVGIAIIAFMALLPLRTVRAQNHGFGFGIILGDPFGATIKDWTNDVNAFDADIGEDYFGSLRIDGDYYWHFNAFHSDVVKLYAGPGLALGFGEGKVIVLKGHEGEEVSDNRVGVGIRLLAGIDVTPPRSPVEVFLQLGPLISLAPDMYAAFDVGVGVRFYP